MSTFYGGEQLVNVFSLDGFTSGGVSDLYTVPNGFYAAVSLISLSTTGALQIHTPSNNVASQMPQRTIASTDIFYLSSGTVIRQVISTVPYQLTVRLYKNP